MVAPMPVTAPFTTAAAPAPRAPALCNRANKLPAFMFPMLLWMPAAIEPKPTVCQIPLTETGQMCFFWGYGLKRPERQKSRKAEARTSNDTPIAKSGNSEQWHGYAARIDDANDAGDNDGGLDRVFFDVFDGLFIIIRRSVESLT